MTIFNMYIFNRHGVCLYYEEWRRRQQSTQEPAEDQKLMFGMLFSLKQFVSKLSPDPRDGVHCCKTPTFKLHYFETLTGIRFVVNTDPNVPDLRETLKHIYSNIFVEFVVKNPLYVLNSPINDCELFQSNLQKYVRSLPCFN
eukprot:c2745_g1_i1.p1 GENE.c2745_g1_i1~~c2745_g1_i1.p1  ORF type:complete len:159 (+),score=23.44 c2745_g1_i1:52-477(+)